MKATYIINPFIVMRKSLNHNPYERNPLKLLGLDDEVISSREIDEHVKGIIWDAKTEYQADENTNEIEKTISEIKSAQRMIERPIDRLCFEIILPDN